MDMSIIIVNWNTARLLIECLDSIYRAEPRPAFEIIVVDNGSTDDSISLVRARYPDVQLVLNDQNLGFARANNQGFALARGRYYLLLNSDTVVSPGALDELVRVADNHPDVGAIGPKLLNKDGTLQPSWASFPTFWSELIGKSIRRRKPVDDVSSAYEVDWVMGACMLVRSETVADIGMMDEGYFFYSEEVDWCFRMNQKGWKVWYLSNPEIYHIWGGSSKGFSVVKLGLLYQNKLRYFNKFHGPLQSTLLRYGLALAYSVGLIPRVLLFNRRNRANYVDRIQGQAKLIWCLLRNKYPAVQG
ncbi:MAG: glycosyltransferase family 2 protein [Anaerolineales bacterium]